MSQPKRQRKREKLEDLIRDLERDLSEGKTQVDALEEAYKRLQESERLCQELADENRRLVEQVAQWRERYAKNGENDEQLNTLRQQLETLQAEHARAIQHTRELEAKLSVLPGQPIDTSVPSYAAHIRGNVAHAFRGFAIRFIQPAGTWIHGNLRLASALAFGALLVVLAVFTVREKDDALSKRMAGYESEQRTEIDHVPEASVKPAVNTVRFTRGVFQTVRPTIVYSQPGEESEIVANIGKGTRVNVVSSQNGWLEIHSKHGRPPGYIRQEVAVRVSSN